ncbi:MAG: 50S ribosomal protein L22 [Bacilli bacterium]|nr:50S ribosomal protein L22 [Bacilli bacterium]
MANSKFLIKKTDTGFNFMLIAPNSQPIGASKVFKSLDEAKAAVEEVKKVAASAPTENQTNKTVKEEKAPKFVIYFDKAEKFRFRLEGEDGSALLSSEPYNSAASARNGVASVAKNAESADVELPEGEEAVKEPAKEEKKAAKKEAKAEKKPAKESKKAKKEVKEEPAKPAVTEAHAFARDVRITPRKVRLVANLVRGKDVKDALGILAICNRVAAKPIEKLIRSASANAVNNFGLEQDKLYISEIQVGDGLKIKRYIPRAKGSASGIIKRNANVRITVKERN